MILGHLGLGLLGSLPLFEDDERRELRAKIASVISAKALVAHVAFGRLHGEITFRSARSLIFRCAMEPHYRMTDKVLLRLCAFAAFPIFTLIGCRTIVMAVNELQKGRSVRVQHVSHKDM